MKSNRWNQIVATFPDPHILQTWQWGDVKSKFGWEPLYKVWGNESCPDAAVLILRRSITIGSFSPRLRILYVPKGPLIRDWGDQDIVTQVLSDLKDYSKEQGAIFIKIDPDISLGTGVPDSDEDILDPLGKKFVHTLQSMGWGYSSEQIQFRNTVLIDISHSEDELLKNMKQKTRYNIRLASRKGVTVRQGTEKDFHFLFKMYAETSLRDGFAIRDEYYYQTLWKTFFNQNVLLPGKSPSPVCLPLIAEVTGEAVAAVVVFRFADQAYYIHGMSRLLHRNLMPNYLLQWEAIKWAKAAGCKVYNLWGAPESFDEKDSMWGVFRFKRGLGGTVLRTIGAYDLPTRPLLFKLYSQILPKILGYMRSIGNRRTRQNQQKSQARETRVI